MISQTDPPPRFSLLVRKSVVRQLGPPSSRPGPPPSTVPRSSVQPCPPPRRRGARRGLRPRSQQPHPPPSRGRPPGRPSWCPASSPVEDALPQRPPGLGFQVGDPSGFGGA